MFVVVEVEVNFFFVVEDEDFIVLVGVYCFCVVVEVGVYFDVCCFEVVSFEEYVYRSVGDVFFEIVNNIICDKYEFCYGKIFIGYVGG